MNRSTKSIAIATLVIWLSILIAAKGGDYLFTKILFSFHPEILLVVKDAIGPDVPKMLHGLSEVTFADWAFALTVKWGFALLISYVLAHTLRALFVHVEGPNEPNPTFQRTASPPLN